jgi:hypothetical protein
MSKLLTILVTVISTACSLLGKDYVMNQNEVRGFESKHKMTISEAYKLIEAFVAKQPSPRHSLPLKSAIVVNDRFLFPREVPKSGGVRERGFYVDPANKTVSIVDTPKRFNGQLTSAIANEKKPRSANKPSQSSPR